ncbi:oxidoreductase [Aeromicrobium sp. CF3.5]|uniref:oxidoreductase n=1 Tax=Aeromicrobium sp. CF3.5 TaxID=3373078 RepID=UPI003EE45B7C
MTWSTANVPDLTGRLAVVTGATGGLGVATSIELARHGARLLLTARNPSKAEESVARIIAEAPGADVQVVSLDLADLADAKRAAREVVEQHDRIDILVNNAGIMATPRRTTVDGFELQIGTNHLGHFAWTAGLWPALVAGQARIVSVSSLAHLQAGGIDLRSLTPQGSPRRYFRWTSYAESKLANLSFAMELHRRVTAAGLDVVSVGAHPGIASTNLTRTGSGLSRNPMAGIAIHQLTRVVAQSASAGATPLVLAATDPSLSGGEYIGPQGLGGSRGSPGPASASRQAVDPALAENLWAASESAAGITFAV